MILVEILNFQAIDRLELTIDGFTALVGRSNIGKSSIVRALKCALTGTSSPDDVRHSIETCSRYLRKTKKCQCFSSVKLTFEEGPSLLWEKGDAVNQYTVWKDGSEQVYHRVGKEADLPDFVGEQFSPVKMGSKHNLLQVSDQFDPLFLLDLPGTVVADTLSDLGQLDAVNKALALAAKDRRAATSTRKIRVSDLGEMQTQLGRYVDLDDTTQNARRVQEGYKAIEKTEARARLASRLLRETYQAAEHITRLSDRLAYELPASSVLTVASSRRSLVTSFDLGWSSRAVAVRGLMHALDAPLPEASGLQEKARRWADAARFGRELANRADVVEQLAGLGLLEIPDLSLVRQKFKAWEVLQVWLVQLQAIKALFDKTQKLRTSPDVIFESDRATTRLARMRQLDTFLTRMQQLQAQETQWVGQLEVADRDEAQILQEFDALGLCPACSQPITPTHIGRSRHEPVVSISD